MKAVSMLRVAAALLLPATLMAQGCPHQVARQIGESVTFHGVQSCGSVQVQISGITLSSANGCPLMAKYTPAHAVPDYVPTSETKVQDLGPAGPTLVISFRCDSDYFLIIPIGSSCVVDQMFSAANMYSRLATIGC
jgi:hypothetical protein